jgi:hypothetical protein
MKGPVALRKPVYTLVFSMASTNIPSGSWVQLAATLPSAASAVEIFNGGGSSLTIGLGAAGHEVAFPYTIIPGGPATVIPVEIPHGSRFVAQTADTSTASAGWLIFNFFQ